MFTKFEHKSIKVTLNKKSKKSTFFGTQNSTLLKRYFFKYSKKNFAQKSIIK